MSIAIRVENLGKRFRRYHADRPPTLKEAVVRGFRKTGAVEQFWALRGVSFEVAYGEMLGIVGHNGAGKSTLLQLIGGVGYPNSGRVRVEGRIGALLDLGAGFSPDLTGRENVLVMAVAAGLSRRDVLQRFDRIVEFAELEDSIDTPLRTYSSGMQMRLAFSVAIHTDPQVLLVDEFLAVGDLSFQTKCLRRIAELKAEGCAIVLISHSPAQINELCDRAIWLRHGEVVMDGPPDVVTGQYTVEMRAETQRRTPNQAPEGMASGTELAPNRNRFGSRDAEVTAVRLLPGPAIASGEPFEVEFEYLTHVPLASPIFVVSITRREDGRVCLDLNTKAMGLSLTTLEGVGKARLSLGRLDLLGGEYWVNVGIFEADWAYAFDYHWEVYPLSIEGIALSQGVLLPPCRWHLDIAESDQCAFDKELPAAAFETLPKLKVS
ncbi:MAG: ABC transporter ATP-binding protein [Gammaproteobacteria bacterium]|nr:ABC transporter ATP-binding protein [Gammaproteobacteria bacterium]